MIDLELIRVYLDCKLGVLSNHGLIRYAQGRLAETCLPDWVLDLAIVDASHVLDAQAVLQRQLFNHRVLPDSELLRSEIRARVLRWCEHVAETGVVESNGIVPSVVQLLKLCPTYDPYRAVLIPIVEYPYPPSGIQDPKGLASYVVTRLNDLIPQAPALK